VQEVFTIKNYSEVVIGVKLRPFHSNFDRREVGTVVCLAFDIIKERVISDIGRFLNIFKHSVV